MVRGGKMRKRWYLVAGIGKYHRPNRSVYGNTTNKQIAFKRAREYAKKYNRPVGVFEFYEDTYKGMIKGFY